MDKCVPDVIDIVPKNVIKIHYPSGVDVNLGNELKPVEVKDEPTVDWPTTQPDDLYTLLMTDPDASVDVREIKHWLIVNIPGNDLAKGELLAPYGGSCPPVEHGLHRYIFLVYKQSGHLQHSEIPMKLGDREGRRNFNTKLFAQKYNLGQPYAGNIYLAKADEYAINLRAQRINNNNNNNNK